MLASAKSAIDLPLHVLVQQYRNSDVEIAYNSPSRLGARHGLAEELPRNIAGIEALVNKAAE